MSSPGAVAQMVERPLSIVITNLREVPSSILGSSILSGVYMFPQVNLFWPGWSLGVVCRFGPSLSYRGWGWEGGGRQLPPIPPFNNRECGGLWDGWILGGEGWGKTHPASREGPPLHPAGRPQCFRFTTCNM